MNPAFFFLSAILFLGVATFPFSAHAARVASPAAHVLFQDPYLLKFMAEFLPERDRRRLQLVNKASHKVTKQMDYENDLWLEYVARDHDEIIKSSRHGVSSNIREAFDYLVRPNEAGVVRRAFSQFGVMDNPTLAQREKRLQDWLDELLPLWSERAALICLECQKLKKFPNTQKMYASRAADALYEKVQKESDSSSNNLLKHALRIHEQAIGLEKDAFKKKELQYRAGYLQNWLKNYDQALKRFDEALEGIGDTEHDQALKIKILNQKASVSVDYGAKLGRDSKKGQALLNKTLAIVDEGLSLTDEPGARAGMMASRGFAYYQLGRYEDALSQYLEVHHLVKDGPYNPAFKSSILNFIGHASGKLGLKLDQALAFQDSAEIFYEQAVRHFLKHKYEKAAAALKKTFMASPAYHQVVRRDMGIVLDKAHSYSGLDETLRICLQCDFLPELQLERLPFLGEQAYERGMRWEKERFYRGGKRSFKQALGVTKKVLDLTDDPVQQMPMYLLQGKAYAGMNKPGQASVSYGKAERLVRDGNIDIPDSVKADLFYHSANAHTALKHFDRAQSLYDESLQLNPELQPKIQKAIENLETAKEGGGWFSWFW